MVATQQSSRREPSQVTCNWLVSRDVLGRIQLLAPPHGDLVTITPLSSTAPALKSGRLRFQFCLQKHPTVASSSFINSVSPKSSGEVVDSSNWNLFKDPTWDLLILGLSLRVTRFSISSSGPGHPKIINGHFTQPLAPSGSPSRLGNSKQTTRGGTK